MLKSWYDDVDEELVAGTLQGTILTMIQYAAQVGPRRSEYTEGDIKFDPKTDLTRANINYYLRDEEGNETKLEPTPDDIREFLSTTDQNTSRAGIRPHRHGESADQASERKNLPEIIRGKIL